MLKNIKAVVLDVDGILVGLQGGRNFPNPSAPVLNAIKSINKKTPVILCTGRPFYTPVMKAVIDGAVLNNFHVGDCGVLVMNPKTDEILFAKELDQGLALHMAKTLLGAGIYTSLYLSQYYAVQKTRLIQKLCR
jgi:hydroxymethylpyrimidine pyrophosphatase-like HAD family hydrolase